MAEGSDTDRVRRRGTIPVLVLALVTGGLLLLVGWRFIVTLLLAAVSAGIAQPLRARLHHRMPKRPGLSAIIVTATVIAVIVVPVGFLLSAVGVGTANLVQQKIPSIGDGTSFSDSAAGQWLTGLSVIRELVSGGLASAGDVVTALQNGSADLVTALGQAAAGVGRFGLLILIYVFALFYFCRDGSTISDAIVAAIPLPDEDKRTLLSRFTSVSRATLKGTAVVGLLQGVTGGVLFLSLSLPAPLVFGTLFAILAAIPSFGAVLIWLPTTIVLVAQGSFAKAAIVVAVAGVLIPLADYIIRPKLIGDDVSLHPLLLLVAILGGLGVFGLAGLLIGPIIAALFTQSWITLTEWNARRGET